MNIEDYEPVMQTLQNIEVGMLVAIVILFLVNIFGTQENKK